MSENVFITGANGGLGRLTLSSLLAAGQTVVATMRNIDILVDTPSGQRPFRTVVDSLGMAEAAVARNDAAEQMTAAIHGAFGMADLLTVNTGQG